MRPASCTHGSSHQAGPSTGVVSRTNGAFITDTVSPRSALKPTACLTSASTRVSSAADSGCGATLPLAPARGTLSTSTATETRLMRPAGWRVCCRVRSSS
ncbi:hypothetical protein G6F66_014834 [Rhizopus arrhizus]|nr:hypothetical protein G6F66_014834 [Rhizopus arrhizus]